MTPLAAIVRAQIDRFGPMSLAEYMTLCLLHPKHGYYMQQNPFGTGGDFVTAPEISQMFGEVLGLCLARSWVDQGQPDRFVLAEPGPGRGTLMADILRATRQVPGFLEAAEIWLIEASPALTQTQQETLNGFDMRWTQKIEGLPEAPLFLIANEFFDALPVQQFQRSANGWQERLIGIEGDRLVWGLGAEMPLNTLEDLLSPRKPGDIVETRPAASAFMQEIALRITTNGGVALIVDYGGWGSFETTFQAVKAHGKTDPLAEPGQADLTAHVDFRALAAAAEPLARTGLTPQGVLLERLGITARAQTLAKDLQGSALENHIAAHRRLTHPDEMGNLFKAIGFYPPGAPLPSGLEPYDA
jgi:NADH dehydrogenase [ubiquinone] 1 alpha subcomplex assembly factor 7